MHVSVDTQMPVRGLAQTQASTITQGLEKMLYRERREELKSLRLPQALRGVFILVCKHRHKEKGCGTKGPFDI